MVGRTQRSYDSGPNFNVNCRNSVVTLQKSPPDGAPVIKRPRGRPKGSKNKNPKVKRMREPVFFCVANDCNHSLDDVACTYCTGRALH